MADLIRTPDDDGEEPEDAVADDIVLAKPAKKAKKAKLGDDEFAGFDFGDLVSDADDDEAGGWDFQGQADAESDEDKGLQATTGLSDKIKARREERELEEQARNEGAGAAGDEAGADEGSAKASDKKGAAKKAKFSAPQKTAEHLRTSSSFEELRLCRPLLRAVAELHFDTPTPIQRDVIPPALQGLDVLATAETGSGKTASFLLPILERLCQSANVRSRKRDATGKVVTGRVATKAMVLIPTRELAVQCHAMLKNLAKYTLATYQLVAGGFDSHGQEMSLRNQPDVVVATPGRLLDHLLNSQSVHMELLEIVIFDEADRLLELGFREECTQVLKRCSRGRQTMLFSATMNTSVEDLAALALVRPVRVHASAPNRVTETLEQEFVRAPSSELREAVLLSLCTRNYTSRAIIFCATRSAAHRLAMIFGLCDMSFAELHGSLPQGDRVRALQRFQEGEADFLLATDLAARGLDIMNVETVINFHLPLDISRYIHRVGRTARMGRVGRAVTVYAPDEYPKVKKLGRQCATKVKSKVLKRSVAAEAVNSWVDKIVSLEDDISAILSEEGVERESRLADTMLNRNENLHKYQDQIKARPPKEWIMTNNEKKKLKEAILEETAATDAKMAEPEVEVSASEKSQARKLQLKRERFFKKKEEEKAERLRDEANARRHGRQARKSAKPARLGQGGGASASLQQKGKDRKKNKRKGRK